MPKAEKEFILNYAMNRWQLNFKKNVGPTSQSIRECKPNNLQDWSDYYYSKVKSYEHINSLGVKLYEKISTILPYEDRFHPELINSITSEDCKSYLHQIVIDRTYNGYVKENGR